MSAKSQSSVLHVTTYQRPAKDLVDLVLETRDAKTLLNEKDQLTDGLDQALRGVSAHKQRAALGFNLEVVRSGGLESARLSHHASGRAPTNSGSGASRSGENSSESNGEELHLDVEKLEGVLRVKRGRREEKERMCGEEYGHMRNLRLSYTF